MVQNTTFLIIIRKFKFNEATNPKKIKAIKRIKGLDNSRSSKC
jgi:hypothetical protein